MGDEGKEGEAYGEEEPPGGEKAARPIPRPLVVVVPVVAVVREMLLFLTSLDL